LLDFLNRKIDLPSPFSNKFYSFDEFKIFGTNFYTLCALIKHQKLCPVLGPNLTRKLVSNPWFQREIQFRHKNRR